MFKGKDYDLTIVSHTEPKDIGIYARDDYYFDYHSDAFKKIMDELNADHRSGQAHRAAAARRRSRSPTTPSTGSCSSWPRPASGTPSSKGLWDNSPVQANDLTGVYWEN